MGEHERVRADERGERDQRRAGTQHERAVHSYFAASALVKIPRTRNVHTTLGVRWRF